MGIRSLRTASISTGAKRSKVWDQSAVVNNNSYESIATTTVGSGGSSTVSFTSIPSTYKHLQIRWLARSTATGGDSASSVRMKINSSAGTYKSHGLVGTGASAVAADLSNSTGEFTYYSLPNDSVTASMFGAGVIDVLDYTNTSKNKVTRMLSGFDKNGGGQVSLQSQLWVDTSAITQIDFTLSTGNFTQYSSFALYGIKG